MALLREERAKDAAEQAEEEAVDAIIALAEMYDAVEAYPPYASHGKNRHRFIGHDLTAISESKSDNHNAQSTLSSKP